MATLKPCPMCGEDVSLNATACPHCGEKLRRTTKSKSHGEGDATGGLIPYKNPMALTAYYLSIASLIPCLFFLGLVSVILGIMGLKRAKQTPAIKGQVHAWIGIILGGGCFLLWGGLVATGVIAAISSGR